MNYKEKLEEANRLYQTANKDQKYVLESLFPELKESEDERIRKAILELVHDTTGDSLWEDYNVHKENALAWLEKRGQTFTKKDVDDAYLKGISDTKNELEKQCEQKPAWTEEDEAMWVEISDLLWEGYKQSGSKFSWDDIRNWVNPKLKSLRAQTAWKPSDEHYELEEFAKIIRCNLTGISKVVQELFEAKYLQLTGNKMYGGYKD